MCSRAIAEWFKEKFGVDKTQIAEVIRIKEVVYEAWSKNSDDKPERVKVCKTSSMAGNEAVYS